MVKLRFNNPKSPSEIVTSNFWWNKIIHPWDVGFWKSKVVEFHGLGWVSMFDVWVASKGILASKEEMGEKLVFSPKKELGYEKIVTKLEKVWGFIERGRQPLQRRRLDWFVGKEQGIFIYGLLCFIYL
jgi:hypothetical protein